MTPGRRQSRFALLGALASGAYLLTLSGVSYDDAYITFRYAARLGQGLGFTYNDGERFLAVTTPLWTVLLGWVPSPGAIPLLAGSLSAVALAVGGWLLARDRDPAAAILLTLVFALNPFSVHALGGEMGLLVLLAAASCARAAAGRELSAFALAGLAFLTRPDAGLLGVVLTLVWLARHRRLPWRGILASMAVAAPWLVFAWIYFGSPLPHTLAAKRWQLALGWQTGFLTGFGRELWGRLGVEPLLLIPLALALVGLPRALRLPTGGPFLLWAGLHTLTLSQLGLPWYHWYAVPAAAAVAIPAAEGLHQLRARLRGSAWLAALLVLLTAVGLVRLGEAHRDHSHRAWKQTYAALGSHLAQVADPHDSVAYYEVGYLGFYSGLPIIDMAGLVTPVDVRQLTLGNTALPLLTAKADWFITKDGDQAFNLGVTTLPWFHRAYLAEARVGDLTLYRRTGELPPPEWVGFRQDRAETSVAGPRWGQPVVQTFVSPYDLPFAVELFFDREDRAARADIVMQIHDTDPTAAPLAEVVVRGAWLRHQQWARITFDPIPGVAGKQLRLVLRPQPGSSGRTPSLGAAAADAYPAGRLYMGNLDPGRDLAVRVFHRLPGRGGR